MEKLSEIVPDMAKPSGAIGAYIIKKFFNKCIFIVTRNNST